MPFRGRRPIVRINRYIAASGVTSRRKADELIANGRVEVNGRPAQAGMTVGPDDRVTVDGKEIRPREDRVVIAFNKPPGITSTSDPGRRDNIIDFINYPRRIFTVGRLDRDSRGLILLTDDGSLAHQIMHSSNKNEKEYQVTVDRPLTDDFLSQMEKGVRIGGRTTLPARAWRSGERSFHIVLCQGLNRQIRRMCEALGYQVTDLVRVRIMHITLGSLAEGTYRELTFKERQDLDHLLQQTKSGRL